MTTPRPTQASNRHIGLRLLLVVALVATALLASQSWTKAPAAAAVTTKLAIKVVGNHLVDGAGNTVVLHGVDITGTARGCINAPDGTPALDAITSSDFGLFPKAPLTDPKMYTTLSDKGVNAIRIPLNEDCWLGINGVNPAWSGKPYQDAIKTITTTAATAGIYTIIDLHLNAPGTNPAFDQQIMADRDHAITLWHSVAKFLKSVPSVIFDPYNEPNLPIRRIISSDAVDSSGHDTDSDGTLDPGNPPAPATATAPAIDPANAAADESDVPSTPAAPGDPWNCWLNGCTVKNWKTGITVYLAAAASEGDTTITVQYSDNPIATKEETADAIADLRRFDLAGSSYPVASVQPVVDSTNPSDPSSWVIKLRDTAIQCSPTGTCPSHVVVATQGAKVDLTRSASSGQWQAAGMQDLVNAIRQEKALQPIMLGGLGWASDASGWLTHAPYDLDVFAIDPSTKKSLGSQLIVATHFYPLNRADCTGTSCKKTKQQILDQLKSFVPNALSDQYPVVMSETGDNADAALGTSPITDGPQAYLPAVLDYVAHKNWSVLAWSYNDWPLKGNPTQNLLLAPAGLGTLYTATNAKDTKIVVAGKYAWAFTKGKQICIGTDCSTVDSTTTNTTTNTTTITLATGLTKAHPLPKTTTPPTPAPVVDDGGEGYLKGLVSPFEGTCFFNFLDTGRAAQAGLKGNVDTGCSWTQDTSSPAATH